MSLISSDARFLGVDLALLWRDMREPWRNVHQWLVFAWLTPQPAVLLHQADGQQSVWQGGQKASARVAPQFSAVELPDEYVLRRSLSLPAMAHEDAMAAMALEARSASPFDPSDLVWGFSHQGRSLAVGGAFELVIASRKQVAQYLATLPAVASAASAALGAISEDQSILGKSLIYVGLAEGVCLYGLIIAFMILGKL